MNDVADRMRSLAALHPHAIAGVVLSAGADEVERLMRELDAARRQSEGDGDLIARLFAEVAEYVDRLAAAEAQARGAQYREREARNEATMLRALLDAARATGDAGDLVGLGRRESWTVTVDVGSEGR